MAQRSRLPMLLSMVVIELAFGSLHDESCVADSSNDGIGASLLQAGNKHLPPLSFSQQHKSQMPKQRQLPPTVGTARTLLPPHLYEVGLQLLQKEEVLDAFVASTVVTTPGDPQGVYAGVNMSLRMVLGNEVNESDAYGVNSLGQKIANTSGPTGMMNMLDIGGNYGRVSIAAFRSYQDKMRIIVVEPVASTYLLLRWNLFLNSVPELTLEEFQASPARPGVVALNNGIADVEGKITDLCYTPPNTMASRICNCSHGYTHSPQEQCVHIIGRTADSLVQMFGNAPIALLKMDCEGCEVDAIPALVKLSATSGLRIERFAGELHALPNELEDFACKFEEGKWFVHICSGLKNGKPGFNDVPLYERCTKGPDRPSCSRRTVSEVSDLPPSEW